LKLGLQIGKRARVWQLQDLLRVEKPALLGLLLQLLGQNFVGDTLKLGASHSCPVFGVTPPSIAEPMGLTAAPLLIITWSRVIWS